jgi:hypothetical protein
LFLLPVALLASLTLSYAIRPANRRGFSKSQQAQGGSIPVPLSDATVLIPRIN